MTWDKCTKENGGMTFDEWIAEARKDLDLYEKKYRALKKGDDDYMPPETLCWRSDWRENMDMSNAEELA